MLMPVLLRHRASIEFIQSMVVIPRNSSRGVAHTRVGATAGYLLTFLAAVLLMSATARSLLAQGTSGSILGAVKDETGSVIAGASVSVTNEQTGLRREMISDSQGYYEFKFLPIGQYTVTANRAGFRTSKVSGVKLEVDQKARVDIELKIGGS